MAKATTDVPADKLALYENLVATVPGLEFLGKYKTNLCKAYGIVQKEYVDVPDALLKKTAELKPYFAKSYAYVSALKAKPTKKKKKSN